MTDQAEAPIHAHRWAAPARSRAAARWLGISRHPLLAARRMLRRQRGVAIGKQVPVSADQILARLVDMPISVWTYGFEHESVRHMGPMAQDFAAAFGLGDTDKRISTVDASGVTMAAIQALNRRILSLEAELDKCRADDSPSNSRSRARTIKASPRPMANR